MKKLSLTVVAIGILSLLAPAVALAQDGGQQIVFGVYYRCGQGQEARADEIHNQIVAPVVQKHVDLGHLTGQLWLVHRQGGPWRRLQATLGNDLDQMMDMRGAIAKGIQPCF